MVTGSPTGFTYPVARRRRAARDSKNVLQANTISFSIRKRGRLWEVLDPEGELICLTAYKKGAAEVVRRLGQT